MDIQTLVFTQQGNGFVSDSFQAEKENVIFHIMLTTPGTIILERSIKNEEFSPAGLVEHSNSTRKIVETQVSGIIVGQYLRLRFSGSVPAKIEVAQ